MLSNDYSEAELRYNCERMAATAVQVHLIPKDRSRLDLPASALAWTKVYYQNMVVPSLVASDMHTSVPISKYD